MYIGSSGLCKLKLIALQCDASDMSECIVAPDVGTFQFVNPRYVLGWKIIVVNVFNNHYLSSMLSIRINIIIFINLQDKLIIKI